MSAQHTPGPWVADDIFEDDGNRLRVGTYNGTPTYYHSSATVALCQTNDDEEEDGRGPLIGIVQAEANARLIAAAPRLLAALKEQVRECVCPDCELCARHEAIIKEAEGGQ